VALINAIAALDHIRSEEPDTQTGINILRRALEEPMRRIAGNAGQNGAVVIDTIRRMAKEQGNINIGYNVMSDAFEDMLKSGIIDPAKVTRSAVENATSIAAMILTTDVLITDVPQKNAAPAMPYGGGGEY
jgi:chaperonin GroEL